MTPKCPRCPISGECPAYLVTCRAIEADPCMAREFAALVERGRQTPQDEPRATVDRSAESASVKATMKLLDEMKACPHWIARSDCGCGVNECRLGKGESGLVTHQDCFECLKPWERSAV